MKTIKNQKNFQNFQLFQLPTALTLRSNKIFGQGFFSRVIPTSILSISAKITVPGPLTKKRHPNHFTPPPLSLMLKSPSSHDIVIMTSASVNSDVSITAGVGLRNSSGAIHRAEFRSPRQWFCFGDSPQKIRITKKNKKNTTKIIRSRS